MDELMGAIADFLVLCGGWGMVAILVILILFFGEKMLTTAEKFWSVFRNVSAFTFKRYTSTRLSNQILHATKAVSSINDDLLPYRVKIKWVRSEPIESFLKNGQVIIKICDDDDINKSFVLAIAEFVRRGLIHNVKRHLKDETLVQAIDLCAVDKILSQAYIESLSYFERDVLGGWLEKNPDFAHYFEELRQIDHSGLFLPVFLNELTKTLHRIDDQYFIEDFEKEANDFLHYLLDFCSQKHKKLYYDGKYIHISFGLIANRSYFSRHGRDAYVEKVRSSLSLGTQTVYLFGWGDKTKIVRQIAEQTAQDDLRIHRVKIHPYRHVFEDHSTARAICIELSTLNTEEEEAV